MSSVSLDTVMSNSLCVISSPWFEIKSFISIYKMCNISFWQIQFIYSSYPTVSELRFLNLMSLEADLHMKIPSNCTLYWYSSTKVVFFIFHSLIYCFNFCNWKLFELVAKLLKKVCYRTKFTTVNFWCCDEVVSFIQLTSIPTEKYLKFCFLSVKYFILPG